MQSGTLHLYEVWLLLLLLLLLLEVLLVEGGQVPRVPHADCAMSTLGGKLQCPARHSDHPHHLHLTLTGVNISAEESIKCAMRAEEFTWVWWSLGYQLFF